MLKNKLTKTQTKNPNKNPCQNTNPPSLYTPVNSNRYEATAHLQ